MDETNIAWASDRNDKFKAVTQAQRDEYNSTHQFIHTTYPSISADAGVTDEHFIVWMRTAALPSFRKLYGKIDTKIAKGETVTFNVTSRKWTCNVVSFWDVVTLFVFAHEEQQQNITRL